MTRKHPKCCGTDNTACRSYAATPYAKRCTGCARIQNAIGSKARQAKRRAAGLAYPAKRREYFSRDAHMMQAREVAAEQGGFRGALDVFNAMLRAS